MEALALLLFFPATAVQSMCHYLNCIALANVCVMCMLPPNSYRTYWESGTNVDWHHLSSV